MERRENMPRRTKIEKKIDDGLLQLAFGDVSEAVSLLYMSDEEALEKLPQLNLFNVSEIKRPRGGGMEIKFFDRIKACEKLRERQSEKQSCDSGFFEALEKSVENTGSVSRL